MSRHGARYFLLIAALRIEYGVAAYTPPTLLLRYTLRYVERTCRRRAAKALRFDLLSLTADVAALPPDRHCHHAIIPASPLHHLRCFALIIILAAETAWLPPSPPLAAFDAMPLLRYMRIYACRLPRCAMPILPLR